MKSSALIPFVVVVAACSAQAAEFSYQKDPTEPPISHFKGSCEVDPDGTKFADKACYTKYYPGNQGFGKNYRPPVCSKRPVANRDKEVLAQIYRRAPDYLQSLDTGSLQAPNEISHDGRIPKLIDPAY